jgi:hypothetical protein
MTELHIPSHKEVVKCFEMNIKSACLNHSVLTGGEVADAYVAAHFCSIPAADVDTRIGCDFVSWQKFRPIYQIRQQPNLRSMNINKTLGDGWCVYFSFGGYSQYVPREFKTILLKWDLILKLYRLYAFGPTLTTAGLRVCMEPPTINEIDIETNNAAASEFVAQFCIATGIHTTAEIDERFIRKMRDAKYDIELAKTRQNPREAVVWHEV